jgi:spore germination protein YaaH
LGEHFRTRAKFISFILLWIILAGFCFLAGIKIMQGEWKPKEWVPSLMSVFQKEKKEAPPLKSTSEPEPPKKEEIIPPIEEEKIAFRASTWFSDYKAMKANIEYYHEVHPFIYNMKGGLSNDGTLISSWSKTSRKERVEEMRALNPKVKIIPTIFRWENPKEKINENIGMNGRKDIRDKHIRVIIEEIETYNYDGIDIDYEGMTCNKKEKFEEFIVLLSKELRKRGKILSVAVHPKTKAQKTKMVHCRGLKKPVKQDFAENWRGPMTHDYEFLAKHVDRFKIMAYELHPRKYHNPGPGPQAPNVWLKSIIEYAATRVPPEKLYMAIPTYGYDWALNCKAKAKAVYYDTALKIKAGNHKMYQPTDITKILEANKNSNTWKNLTKFKYIHERKVYEDPSLWYKSGGCDRVAFYMNKRAFEEKMTLLRKYNLAGFSFWQLLTNNDPAINDYLKLLMTGKLPAVTPITHESDSPNPSDLAPQEQSLEKENLPEEERIPEQGVEEKEPPPVLPEPEE